VDSRERPRPFPTGHGLWVMNFCSSFAANLLDATEIDFTGGGSSDGRDNLNVMGHGIRFELFQNHLLICLSVRSQATRAAITFSRPFSAGSAMTTASRTVGSDWILLCTSNRSTRLPATLTMPSARPSRTNRSFLSGWTSSPVTQNHRRLFPFRAIQNRNAPPDVCRTSARKPHRPVSSFPYFH